MKRIIDNGKEVYLTDLEATVYANSHLDFRTLANHLNRTQRGIEMAWNRVCRKLKEARKP